MSRDAITRHGNYGNRPIEIVAKALRFYHGENFARFNNIKCKRNVFYYNVIIINGVLKSDQMLFKRYYNDHTNESYLSPDSNRDTR